MATSAQNPSPNKPDEGPRASKRPKTRKPAGMRERILRTPLPLYSGPYSIGMMDIEVPAREPRTFSEIKREHRHLLELETVLFTVFYPSGFGSGAGPSPGGEKKWSRPTWLPRPRVELAKGYGKFAGIPSFLAVPWFGITTAFTKLPAFRNAEIAAHWPTTSNSHEAGYETKLKAGDPPPGEPPQPTFPLLIFSHGLGGTRTTYSSVCGEFASYGFIVLSLEHRDGSGPRTFINLPEGETKLNNSKDEMLDISEQDRQRGFSRMDYVFPENNERDTAPGNSKGVDIALRKAQIQLRIAEIEEAYYIMTRIHDGFGEEVAKASVRGGGKGVIGGSSRGLKGINWDSWKGRFHLQQVTMLGHSFGAATTIEILRHLEDFPYITQGIIYDIWGAAIQAEEEGHRVSCPLLGINSEAFMYWGDNFEEVMKICKEVKEEGGLAWLLTVKGSVHLSQSDFSLLYPRVSSMFLKMTVNPRRAIDLNINASLEYLKKVMPERISVLNKGSDEGLLKVNVLEGLPEEGRPDDKWMGVRLRIPHELRIRLTPMWVRRLERRRMRKLVAKDPKGKELDHLGTWGLGEEIWMHVAPTNEELERWGIRRGSGPGESSGELAGEGEEGTGMVGVSGNEGRKEGARRGIEQRYMERG